VASTNATQTQQHAKQPLTAARWEIAQQYETYKQVMESTVTRLRGDVEAYAEEVRSLRSELSRRDKQRGQSDQAIAKAHSEAKEATRRAAQAESDRQKEVEDHRHNVATLTKQRNDAMHKMALLQRQVQELSDQVTDAEANHARILTASLGKLSKSHSTMFTQTTVSQGNAATLQTSLLDVQRQGLSAASRDTSVSAALVPSASTSHRGTQTVNSVNMDEIEETSRLRLLVQELKEDIGAQKRIVAAAESRETALQERLDALEMELTERDEAEVALKTQVLKAEQALRLEKADREREEKERLLTRLNVGTQASISSDDRMTELQEELRLWHQKCRDAEDQADELLASAQLSEQEREQLVADRDGLEERLAAAEAQIAQLEALLERERAAHQQQQQAAMARNVVSLSGGGQQAPATPPRKAQPPKVPAAAMAAVSNVAAVPSRVPPAEETQAQQNSSPPTLTRNSSNRAVLGVAAGASPTPARPLSSAAPPQVVTSLKALPPGLTLVKGPPKMPASSASPSRGGPPASAPHQQQHQSSLSPLGSGASGPAVRQQTFESYMAQDPAARIAPPPPSSLPRRSPSISS
jgi:hypothetical protein